MQQLGDLLEQATAKSVALKICRILKTWEEIVPERIKRNTEAKSVKGRTLFVAAKSPAWANELTLLKNSLIEKINAAMGMKAIKDIRFQGGKYG